MFKGKRRKAKGERRELRIRQQAETKSREAGAKAGHPVPTLRSGHPS
jgi:hypothetical protein